MSKTEDAIERELASEAKRVLGVEPPGFPRAGVSSPQIGAPYAQLERILKLAYEQAAAGKGRERHASSPVGNRAWHEQPILANARQIGPGGPAMQIMKKAQESVTMAGNRDFTKAKAEALGAIVYAAALYKLYEEMEQA